MSPTPGEDADLPPTGGDEALRAAAAGLSAKVSLIAAGGMHLVLAAFVLPVGRIVPGWAAAVLLAGWAAGAVAIWRGHRTRPVTTLLVPPVSALLWWVVVALSG